MKLKSNLFLEFFKANYNDFNIVFLYGTNYGLIELLYKNSLEHLQIDKDNPFIFSKVDGNKFKETPSLLCDNMSTLSIFMNKRTIILDLINITITKNLQDIILSAIKEVDNNYLLFIKAGNLKMNSFVKYFQELKNCISVPCYEEDSTLINNILLELIKKYELNFSKDFITQLASKFSEDSLINEMEIKKLEAFLINNKNVTEEVFITLLSNNERLGFDKVVEYCSKGNTKDALSHFDRVYDNQTSSITLIRSFVNHFKLLEKILLVVQTGKNISYSMNNVRPPVFFKKREFIISQCNLWNLKTIDIILKRLIKLELECKFHNHSEKTLLAQFILSTSVMAKNKIKT